MEWFIPSLVLLLVVILSLVIYYALLPPPGRVAEQRSRQLGRLRPAHGRATGAIGTWVISGSSGWWSAGLHALARLVGASRALSGRRQEILHQAGYYDHQAAVTYVGAQVLLGLLLPVVIVVLLGMMGSPLPYVVSIPFVAAGVGFWLPSLYLMRRASNRRLRLRRGLPDALDMMVSCVEAGLGLNAALVRVARELERVHPDLSKELQITTVELRTGKTRDMALRNLGRRTGVKDLTSFAAMLIQAERFGVSVAQALRVFADSLRTKRRQRAEKAAAETSIKLVFPLVFFIFPALFIVLIGPAMIQMIESLSD